MPLYTFSCADCGAGREVIADLQVADSLELMCTDCGGDMTRSPVLKLNVIGPGIEKRKAEKAAEERAYFGKACGHNHACRCGVKIDKPNPFKQQIREAHGFTDEV